MGDRSRIIFFQIIFGLVGVVYLVQLFALQVIDDSFKELANDNVIRKITTFPTRGLVYDRNKELIVTNEPVYDILVTPRLVENIDTAKFCTLLDIDTTTFKKNLAKATRYSRYRPSNFIKQISKEQYAQFQEYLFQFKGFYPLVRTLRKYPFANASHILGYIGEVDDRHIRKEDSYYQLGDYIGKTGIEKEYELNLRGEKGYRYIMVDVHINLQLYGERLMQNKKGSIVAINPKNGEILAMVSNPTYDPNLLNGRERGNNFSILSNDTLKPLFNRSIQAKYIPGSTFKPLVALIALQEGAIYANQKFYCGGSYKMGNMVKRCSHNHNSATNVPDAIKESCNPYFWQTFRALIDGNENRSPEQALQVFNNHLYEFGLGKQLGIDLPNEAIGNVHRPEQYDKTHGKGRWKATTIISLAIGQGEMEMTTLQMANMMTIIANRGFYYPPHLVRPIPSDTSKYTFYTNPKSVSIDNNHFETVIKGLDKVGKRLVEIYRFTDIDGLDIAGKTGTADNPHGEPHSLFTCFAPKNDPQIAVAVIVENSGYGATYAAPIAGLMIEQYLNNQISERGKWIEKKVLETNLINPKAEEDEAANE